MFDEEKAPPQIKLETLSRDDNGLAPKLDWKSPPPVVAVDKIPQFRNFLQAKGVNPETIDDIFEHTRYINEQDTATALGLLANRIEQLTNTQPRYLIHLGPEDKSGKWISQRLHDEFGIKEIPITVDELIKLIKSGQVVSTARIFIPDDIMITGDQITDGIIKTINDECGVNWLKNITIALIAAPDTVLIPGGWKRRYLSKIDRIIRVYKTPTLGEETIKYWELPYWKNEDYILTFLANRVSDQFLPLLTRTGSHWDEGREEEWIVDNTFPAPYEKNKSLNISPSATKR